MSTKKWKKSKLKKAKDGLGRSELFALRQRLHRATDEDELLLEVVEADHAVDLVPVVDAGLEGGVRRQLQVHALVKQDVEKLEEEVPVRELLG